MDEREEPGFFRALDRSVKPCQPLATGDRRPATGDRRRGFFAALATLSSIVMMCAMLVANSAVASAAPASGCAAARAVVNTGGGNPCNNSPVILSPQEQTIRAKKQALASEYAQVRAGRVSYATFARDWQAFITQYGGPIHSMSGPKPYCIINPDSGKCEYSSNSVGLRQQPQAQYYYCGPAAAVEILGVRGVSKSQDTLATRLQTTTDGTTWNPYEMGPALDYYTNSGFYVPVNGSGVGGGFSESTYADSLMNDVDAGWALAGNTVEYGNQDPHLANHPRSLTIYHWIGIYGYASYGNYTSYADSIAGTHFWTWSGSVYAYNTGYSSTDMTTLLNQRGYVW